MRKIRKYANNDGREAGYHSLANAIVEKAVYDYRAALTKLVHAPSDVEAAKDKYQLEKFFQSDDVEMYTSLDGSMIMNEVKKQVGGTRYEVYM